MVSKQHLLRQLPAISVILEQEALKQLMGTYSHPVIADTAGEVVRGIREAILGNSESTQPIDLDSIVSLVVMRLQEKVKPKLRKVINATGIILHTNLGRAVLAKEAVKAIEDIAANYSNLELDLNTGERGTRYSHVEELICSLTGAEAALVVNNNAAAVLLVLNTLAKDKEVIVSRGQLVEIGGSFRIPDVMTQSGAVLVEVGTTNKTHLRDYGQAITEQTALLLKVHTSNYKIIGFTAEVPVDELVQLGMEKKIPVYEDLGSGVLVDFVKYGVSHEPTVRESIGAGAHVVTCSGDKLFGGPQAGIIVGRADLISKMKKNQLTRALRIDKLTLAAMEATLRLYLDEGRALAKIPTLRMIMMKQEEILAEAKKLAEDINQQCGSGIKAALEDGYSQVGGGAMPEENLPTCLVTVNISGISINALEARLRQMDPPVLSRIQKDRLLIDPRTLLPGDAEIIINHLRTISDSLVTQEND